MSSEVAPGTTGPVTFVDIVEWVGKAVDAVGVAVIVLGVAAAAAMTLTVRRGGADAYRLLRQRVGRAILLGLELLVAADIIRTVAVRPTFTSAGVLAIIVAIRTFLSFSLEIELEGRLPWSGALGGRGADVRSDVTQRDR